MTDRRARPLAPLPRRWAFAPLLVGLSSASVQHSLSASGQFPLSASVQPSLFASLLVALGIGALIGLEREQSTTGTVFAGSRTLPLIALFGALEQAFFPDLLSVSLVLLVILVIVAYVAKIVTEGDIGMTTVIATILTFVYGAMTTHSEEGLRLAIVFGGLTTVLLAIKTPIHDFVDKISPEERRSTLQFIIVSLVILPVLPNRSLDWLFGLNPQFVWFMVVFVSGLGLVGYVLTQNVGPERGFGITGLLGGFVSSTATAVSMAERARQNAELATICGLATAIASITMFPRMLIEVAVVNASLIPIVVIPFALMAGGSVVAMVLSTRRIASRVPPKTEVINPFRLRPALLFGALFAVVLVLSERANGVYGSTGVYATALVSGFLDVNSITISLSKLALEGAISPQTATVGLVVAATANTITKIVIAWILGTRRFGRTVTLLLGATVVIGLAILLVS